MRIHTPCTLDEYLCCARLSRPRKSQLMIIALDGRRIDALDATRPRFPQQNVEIVRRRIRALLESENASILVSSAACGADLLALCEAASLGLRSRIVLPFDRETFRV